MTQELNKYEEKIDYVGNIDEIVSQVSDIISGKASDLVFDLECELENESPKHQMTQETQNQLKDIVANKLVDMVIARIK